MIGVVGKGVKIFMLSEIFRVNKLQEKKGRKNIFENLLGEKNYRVKTKFKYFIDVKKK